MTHQSALMDRNLSQLQSELASFCWSFLQALEDWLFLLSRPHLHQKDPLGNRLFTRSFSEPFVTLANTEGCTKKMIQARVSIGNPSLGGEAENRITEFSSISHTRTNVNGDQDSNLQGRGAGLGIAISYGPNLRGCYKKEQPCYSNSTSSQ